MRQMNLFFSNEYRYESLSSFEKEFGLIRHGKITQVSIDVFYW